ncbi:polysaccharide pyruvyl transferase family protein, partial [Psychrobacter celer]|uniref:polysaccharide pyruvyl transferase family protein n=1 Tax=Psychrobacter celer TaxID=306572 RepID=UPI003FD04286
MNNRIKVLGYYGMDNYGDDLFSLLSYISITKNFGETECKVIDNSDYKKYMSFFRKNYSSPNIVGKATRLSSYLHSTLATDYYMFCGGSLYSRASKSLTDVLYPLNFDRYSFHAMGVSVGPFESVMAERKANEILKNYEYIALRDIKSFDRVREFNLDAKVVLAGDLAGLGIDYLKCDPKDSEDSAKKVIGFSPCNVQDKKLGKIYVSQFISNMKELKKHLNFEVKIICLNQNKVNGDLVLCELAKSLLNYINIESNIVKYKDIGVEKTWIEISKLDFFVSVRLHGAITAYLN